MNNTSDPTENNDTNNNRIHPCEVMLKMFSISYLFSWINLRRECVEEVSPEPPTFYSAKKANNVINVPLVQVF